MSEHFLILGGGLAGLTAAYELLKRQKSVTLLETRPQTGGLARTLEWNGFRFDLGGHRFHSYNPLVTTWLKELLGEEELLTVQRQSQVYQNGRYWPHPIQFPAILAHLPWTQKIKLTSSYLLAPWRERRRTDTSFEDWVVRRYGVGMYEKFFQGYTQKVWGMSGASVSANWATQRIQTPTLWRQKMPQSVPVLTPTADFYYPRSGFGQIGQALEQKILALGGEMSLATRPLQIQPHSGGFIVTSQTESGLKTHHATDLISTIPLPHLLDLLPLDTRAEQVRETHALSYRWLIFVFIALKKESITPNNWVYFPEKGFIFGRVYEPKNWSPAMVPNPDVTSLGVEIFAGPQEPVWGMTDQAIQARVLEELTHIGWFQQSEVIQTWVQRVPFAYPLQDVAYEPKIRMMRQFLAQWPGLHLVGRTGNFQYINSDGVIEDVFRFLAGRFGGDEAEQLPLEQNGRWV